MNMKDLDNLIDYIMKEFNSVNEKWILNDKYKHINLRKKKVIDIINDKEIYDTIVNYYNFVFILFRNINIDLTQKLRLFNNRNIKCNWGLI